MTMMVPETNDELLAKLDVEPEIQRVDVTATALLNRSEVEAQIDAAHKHHRSVAKFLREAMGLATLTREVAASCIYALPRGGKTITGPSVRLAEIAASAYGNLHVAARVLDADEKEITAQGAAWDLEKNLRVTVEVRRRITKKNGQRFDDDMITVAGNAAASIALRNAIFRVVPRAYIDTIYGKVREVAVGDAKTLESRREASMQHFEKLGVMRARVLTRLGRENVEDVGLDDLEVLIGLATAIKGGDVSIEEAFPAAQAVGPKGVVAAPVATKDLEDRLRKPKAAKPTEEPAKPPLRDFDAEAAALRTRLSAEYDAATGDGEKMAPAKLAELRADVERFCDGAPEPAREQAWQFWTFLTGEKR